MSSGAGEEVEQQQALQTGELTPTATGYKKKIDVQQEIAAYRKAMLSHSSTLVETVSIDYEDFNESFLTCGTCLCMYDGGEHTPKLMACSHTVCLHCLERIVATFARDTGQFRCPICRELITIPRGGVQALPPSFLVNQLLDLMARQRREVIPKCSTHHNQELLFCETCDTVFCTLCTGGTHSADTGGPGTDASSEVDKLASTADEKKPGTSATDAPSGSSHASPSHNGSSVLDHTVIPFSIAIKRMSEILIYKANECRAKLSEANEAVSAEIHRLDHQADAAFENVDVRYQALLDAVEEERQCALAAVRRKRDEKKKVLEEQIQIIQQEKQKVDQDVKDSQHQVEVRNITKKISDLNCKLDTVSTLSEPRENAYIEYVAPDDYPETLKKLKQNLSDIGKVKTSKTFPSLCRATMGTAIAHVEMVARVTTLDYHGEIQSEGGDPVTAEVLDDKGDKLPIELIDNNDGTYDIKFTPHRESTFCLKVLIFGRPIKDCPLFFDVSEHNPPVISFGSRGTKEQGFSQPCNVTVHPDTGDVFVVDTGNSRIKRLSKKLDFIEHIMNPGLEGRSVTGLCLDASKNTLLVINWRSKTVTEMDFSGETVSSFVHDDFLEPIDIAVSKDGEVLVADNGLAAVLVFDAAGALLRTIGGKPNESIEGGECNNKKPAKGKGKAKNQSMFKDLSAVCVAPEGQIVVADSRIQVFSSEGTLLREVFPEGKGKGRYGGLSCDPHGFLVATRTERARSFIQVFNFESGSLYSAIDSHGCKMRRPTGLSVMKTKEDKGHLVVVDIASDCVRKYRYF